MKSAKRQWNHVQSNNWFMGKKNCSFSKKLVKKPFSHCWYFKFISHLFFKFIPSFKSPNLVGDLWSPTLQLSSRNNHLLFGWSRIRNHSKHELQPAGPRWFNSPFTTIQFQTQFSGGFQLEFEQHLKNVINSDPRIESRQRTASGYR